MDGCKNVIFGKPLVELEVSIYIYKVNKILFVILIFKKCLFGFTLYFICKNFRD